MKRVKLICAAIFSIALLTTTATAQQSEKSIEEIVTLRTQSLDEQLDLSDEQAVEVYNISLKYAKKAQELKNSSASRREKYKTFQADAKAQEADMKKVLTSEQFKVWKEIAAKNKEQMKANRK